MKHPLPLLIAAVTTGIVILVTAAWWVWRPAPVAPSASDCRKVLYWHDPMVPGYRSDKPGKSPFMDMQLVPVCEDTGAMAGSPVVTVRAEIIQRLGVRTHRVTRGVPAARFAATGYVFRDARGTAVLVDLFEREAGPVRVGTSAEIRHPDRPEVVYRGQVEAVEPDLDIGARSLKARVRVPPDGVRLPVNQLVEVVLTGRRPTGHGLYVPREALIRTGQRTALVLALGEGRFQPVEVVAGTEIDDWVEIRQGIKEGDAVVISGQFLLDSESSVRASFRRLQSEPAPPLDHKDKP
jgi:hypothetical protein